MTTSREILRPGNWFEDCGEAYGHPLRFEFDYNGRHVWWNNRVGVPDPKAEYMVLFVVAPDGTITEKHCQEPCELPFGM